MDPMVGRILKPLLVAAVMFGGMLSLSGSPLAAMACAMVPLLLGWLQIMESFAYSATAVVLILAVSWALLPVPVKGIVHSFSNEVAAELRPEKFTDDANTVKPELAAAPKPSPAQ
jgi:hypothetical protein